MKRLSAAVAAVTAAVWLLLLSAPPATADVNDAISTLRTANLYVDPTANATIDESGAAGALSGSIKIAVLPAGAGTPAALAQQIGVTVGGPITVGVFVGHTFNAGSRVLCAGQASSFATRAVNENKAQLSKDNDLTNTVRTFASLVRAAGSCANGSGGGSTGSSGSSGSGTSGWAVLGGLGVLGAAGVGGLVWRRRRKDRQALADARALIQPYYDRLAADINTLQPGSDPTARQALADASERFNSGGAQLASATTLAQLGGARRSILEGLQASRTARTALGIDPGPELPPLVESTAPQLTEAQQVSVGGQNVQGYPNYTPGAPYYFAGGGGYAGGWYSMPFWQTLLIAEALSPGWGWGFGGFGGGWGGYGSGYDSGFNSGFDAGQDAADGAGGSGGDWGSSGGGDWGSGGGDWGGGGGGGDWGGGGGGGDSGGGSW